MALRHFHRIAEGLNVDPLLEKVEQHPELWRQIEVRQKHPGSNHSETETIFLRGPMSFSEYDYFHQLFAKDYPAHYQLRDVVLPLVAPVMRKIGALEIGKVMVVKLHPKSMVSWHVDEGRYADVFSRFHIPLQTTPDCRLLAGAEDVHMRSGEAWWFNHKMLHCALNNSDQDRIHLIFDAISPTYRPGARP